MNQKQNFDVEDLRKMIMPIIRIAVLGPKGVGKTSLINQFVNNSFDLIYEETDSDIRKYKKVHDLNANPTDPQFVVFLIDDIFPTNHTDLVRESDYIKSAIYFGTLENRQSRFKQGQQNLLEFDKQIYAYIFVYDATDEKKSFQILEEPIRYIIDYCETKRNFSQIKTKKFLVANKVDLISNEMQNKLFNKNLMKFLEKFPVDNKYMTSAKTGFNVNQDIGKLVLGDQKLDMVDKDWIGELGQSITDISAERKKKNQNDKKKKQQKGGKGFMGCGESRKPNPLDEDVGDEEVVEDDEFANLEVYPGMMDDNQDGCIIY